MGKLQELKSWFVGQKLFTKLALGCGTLLLLCMLCSFPLVIIGVIASNALPDTTKAEQPAAINTDLPANTTAAEVVVQPSNTPKPTKTAMPAPTEDHSLVRPGTYMVGTDIQPGLYIGSAGSDIMDSCYWARLNNLTGNIDSILANDNGIGQYYVEILPSDMAFETSCPLKLYDLNAPSANPFPTQIQPGTYLVGRDIQSGTYKGQAGTDIMDSCYWVRLNNVNGDFNSIIANDNAVGQFYVQISGGDFAFSTKCVLDRVGD
jgi:hypothetical protein